MRIWKNFTPWLFLTPTLALLGLVAIYPIVYSFYLSFTSWTGGMEPPKFIGFLNYIRLFQPRLREGHYFLRALWHTLIWTGIFLTFPVAVGLIIAMMVDANVRGENVFKAVFYVPMVLSFVVLGLMWRWMYVRNGVINSILAAIGLGNLRQNWLGDPRFALYSVIGAASWRHIAYCMIIFLAGLRNIPPDLIEASKIDGAGKRQTFVYVVLPLLRPATIVVIATTIISSFKIFDIVFAMTQGGPFGSSDVLSNRMYQDAFWNMRLGHASTIAVFIFVMVALISFPYIKKMTTPSAEF